MGASTRPWGGRQSPESPKSLGGGPPCVLAPAPAVPPSPRDPRVHAPQEGGRKRLPGLSTAGTRWRSSLWAGRLPLLHLPGAPDQGELRERAPSREGRPSGPRRVRWKGPGSKGETEAGHQPARPFPHRAAW